MSLLSIQPSFGKVVNDVASGFANSEEFWVNFVPADNLEDGNATEEYVEVSKSGDELVFSNKNGLQFIRESEHQYKINYRDTDYNLTLPKSQLETFEAKSVNTSFDISIDQDLYLIGNDSGELIVGNLADGQPVNKIEGAHFSSVLHSLFFPSGKVALTAGLDYQIKIWDVLNGSNPRTFLGHTQKVSDLAIIDRGRNFVSSSDDGTVKLWDCASGLNISTFERINSIKDQVNTLLISDGGASLQSIDENTKETVTSGKTVFAGNGSGVISQFDISSKDQISLFKSLHSGVSSLVSYTENLLIAGYKNGTIALWDKRNSKNPLSQLNSLAEINSVNVISGEIVVQYKAGYICKFSSFPDEKKYLFSDVLSGFENDSNVLMPHQASSLKTINTLSHGEIYRY